MAGDAKDAMEKIGPGPRLARGNVGKVWPASEAQ